MHDNLQKYDYFNTFLITKNPPRYMTIYVQPISMSRSMPSIIFSISIEGKRIQIAYPQSQAMSPRMRIQRHFG